MKSITIASQSQEIANRIFTIRGAHVMLDEDLAELYAVEVRVLNQAVKRNIMRFPPDFMFQLTREEWTALRSQNVIIQDELQYAMMDYMEMKILVC